MFFHKVRQKWIARVRYRKSNGRRHYKSKAFATRPEADEGLIELKAEHAKCAARERTKLLTSIRSKPNAVYRCPACRAERQFKDRRIVRDSVTGEATVICNPCFKTKENHAQRR